MKAARKLSFILILAGTLALASTAMVHHQAARAATAAPNNDPDIDDPKNPDGTFQFTNRLGKEQSPYLLQHAHNPVDWYPWGDEAFEKARKENKPIFLSVGYSTCHWCHVMERESFSQPDVAKLLNENFVAIKVDREERPDIDSVYMAAVQLMTNAGGWPETTVLLPDGRPFFGATYLPKDKLIATLTKLSGQYRNNRPSIDTAAGKVAESLQKLAAQRERAAQPLERPAADKALRAAVSFLHDCYDAARGGFSPAPKFPPHTSLNLLFFSDQQNPNPRDLQMAIHTLDAMALGGIHDHVGGGFHRYSTDNQWKLPHFEKMLYDNAELGSTYTQAYQTTHQQAYKEVADDTYGWVLREMTDPSGGFYSALDADAAGVEGSYYVWTKQQIIDVLGPEDGALFCRVYQVEEDGNYQEMMSGPKTGRNVLYLAKPLDDAAKDATQDPAEFHAEMAGLRNKLLTAREKRVHPRLDDKVLAGWNGLMIGSLARAGAALKELAYTQAAVHAADFAVKNLMKPDGTLLHRWRGGQAGIPAFQDDYAFLANGLLDLADATGDARWSDAAHLLADAMLSKFWDGSGGGLFETDRSSSLLVRLKDGQDNVLPSGNAIAAIVLARLGRITGDTKYSEKARAILDAYQSILARDPGSMQTMVIAAGDVLSAATAPSIKPAGLSLPAPEIPTGLQSHVTVSGTASPLQAKPGARIHIAIALAIESGWHINSHTPLEANLIPANAALGNGGLDVALDGAPAYPTGRSITLGFSKTPLSVYEDTVTIDVPLTIAKTASAGPGEIILRVSFQACNDKSCSLPETREISVPITVQK